jgi:hypothetical protein
MMFKPQEHRRWTYNSHKFRGVYRVAATGRFRANIGGKTDENRQKCSSESFETALEAAYAYDEMARERYGDKAVLNFPYKDKSERGVAVIEKKEQRPPIEIRMSCSNGHPYELHGTFNAKAGVFRCRQCNLTAALKYKDRLRRLKSGLADD